eukprot:PLAT15344.1.p1 GENE.PLAT15344.1~~PLAT15344.1.p1  ORF type:complete len:452 (+),score=227.29 PLAT15344.1:79-1434(+)
MAGSPSLLAQARAQFRSLSPFSRFVLRVVAIIVVMQLLSATIFYCDRSAASSGRVHVQLSPEAMARCKRQPDKKLVMVIYGTRPEAVKVAPIVQLLQSNAYPELQSFICLSGQHEQMANAINKVFNLKPDANLHLMAPNQTLPALTSRVMDSVTSLLSQCRPDVLLVQGDTTTAAVAAMAALYAKVPVGHVEAGLRTWDIYSPFPEEFNRQQIALIAKYSFAPTEQSMSNLRRWKLPEETLFLTGNTAIDSLLEVSSREPNAEASALLSRVGGHKLVLVTAHRRENHGAPLQRICEAFRTLATERTDIRLVYPVHYNPNVRRTVYPMLEGVQGIILTDPLDYETLVHMQKAAYIIVTDSGGIQEEGPSLAKPVLVLRENTERPEGVAAGAAKLIGTDTRKIVREVSTLLDDKSAYARMARLRHVYGDGQAARRILDAIAGRPVSPFQAATS